MKKNSHHNNMAFVKSKDTKPEMIVRKGLWKKGFRYRLNHKRLPGHPDLGAEEIQDLYLYQRVFLAWTQCGDATSE